MLSLYLICAALAGLFVSAILVRRRERQIAQGQVQEIREAKRTGSSKALLQHPHIDLTRCMGCGLCVEACPEEGVLEVVYGQARVVHGARCVGHGVCAAACPPDAIAITLGEVETRKDLPALEPDYEVIGAPGLFLAGEVTGLALVKTAVVQGTAVGKEAARRLRTQEAKAPLPGGLDLLVVGAGPAGLSCALSASEAGLNFLLIDQETFVGGTVAKYPRRKLVMTQPVDLPLHGRLTRSTYQKEELTELWSELCEQYSIPFQGGHTLESVEVLPEGGCRVHTNLGVFESSMACLALGRRGTPRKLGVPGEELQKVSYSLVDAQAYAGRKILVVGGGDSAIEAALGLAAQPGTEVSVSYRRPALFRLKAANLAKWEAAVADGTLRSLLPSQVVAIQEYRVLLSGENEAVIELPNQDVFILAGGEPPFKLLERCGVSLDPQDRRPEKSLGERGSGIAQALMWASLACALAAFWAVWYRDYYVLDSVERLSHSQYSWLRPASDAGLAAGILSVVAVVANLLYLLRRKPGGRLRFGALRIWMTLHVATGISAGLLALTHAGFKWHSSPGGFALAAMGGLIASGAMGRYLYAFLPRANNGRELALDELHGKLETMHGDWDGDHPVFRERVHERVQELVQMAQESTTFTGRIWSLVRAPINLSRMLKEIQHEGQTSGVPDSRIADLKRLARRSHRMTLAATWHEEMRAVMASWRYLHRWVAVILILVLVVHIITAFRYAPIGFGR
ncbi:MAG: thioredoxin reductase/Pyruvate/2-oxoacid:ferredoxin oxidoreductase delta subunit [Planctomycetota bacterium]|jgi:thioredoxin reductase/Pyruvate/2-oxoacid:ferredoxin oxidoreductase delta subunit